MSEGELMRRGESHLHRPDGFFVEYHDFISDRGGSPVCAPMIAIGRAMPTGGWAGVVLL